MIELKKCPKCGSDAYVYSDQVFAWCDVYHMIRCRNEYCGERTSRWDNPKDAANEWNGGMLDEKISK